MSETPDVSTGDKITTWTKQVKQQFKPSENIGDDVAALKNYLKLDTWHYLIIIGIAVSGLAAFVNTYDAISDINKNLKECTQSNTLAKEWNTQFIVLLVLSCFAVLLGLVLAWFFRNQDNPRRLVTLGIMTTGILGIFHALSLKFQNTSNTIKLFASWITFLGFVLLGWFLSSKKNIKTISSISWTDD